MGTKVTKRNLSARINLLVMDGEEHKLDESYDWIAEGIEPQIATRNFMRNRKVIPEDLDSVITEGKRMIILHSLLKGEVNGYYKVQWPNREMRNKKSAKGYYNVRNCLVQLTDKGKEHIQKDHGIYGAMITEMRYGIATGRLKVNIEYISKLEFDNTDYISEPLESKNTVEEGVLV